MVYESAEVDVFHASLTDVSEAASQVVILDGALGFVEELLE